MDPSSKICLPLILCQIMQNDLDKTPRVFLYLGIFPWNRELQQQLLFLLSKLCISNSNLWCASELLEKLVKIQISESVKIQIFFLQIQSFYINRSGVEPEKMQFLTSSLLMLVCQYENLTLRISFLIKVIKEQTSGYNIMSR